VRATAILAAAGSGERLGAEVPKAFVELAGRPMLEWSLDALAAAESIGEIVAALPPNDTTGTVPSVPGATAIEGGPSRSESVANALARVETELVVVHDAARPLATAELFEAVVAALADDPGIAGVVAASPVTDTTKQAADDGVVERTLDRSHLWSVQTPQAFRSDPLREALAGPDVGAASDDAMLVERAGGRVLVHPAPPENLKVTTPLDLRIAEALLFERTARG
jgi:2-C-methyl-D-erythritol 4-phosphate cytidylyltransferase